MVFDESSLRELKKILGVRYPSFNDELARVNFKINNNLKYHTAATDGENIFFDSNFMARLDEETRLFIAAHELLHVEFAHMFRLENIKGQKKDMGEWNTATDAIINVQLEHDGFTIPKGAINMPEAYNHSSEEVYEMIMKKKEQDRQNKQNNDGNKKEKTDNSGDSDNENGQSVGGSSGGGESSDDDQSAGGNGQPQDDDDQSDGASSQSKDDSSKSGNDDDQSEDEMGENDGKSGNGKNNRQNGKDDNKKSQDPMRPDQSDDKSDGDENDSGDNSGEPVYKSDHSMWEKANEDRKNGVDENSESKTKQKIKDLIDKMISDNKSQKQGDKAPEKDDETPEKDDETPEKDDQIPEKDDQIPEKDDETPEISPDEKNNDKYNEPKRFKENDDLRKKNAREYMSKLASKGLRTATNIEVGNLEDDIKPVVTWPNLLNKLIQDEEERYSQDRSPIVSYGQNISVSPWRIIRREEYKTIETEILIDTSGSVTTDMIRRFLQQVRCIRNLRDTKIKVACFDTSFYNFSEIKSDKDVKDFRIRGGGGTDFNMAVQHFSDKPIDELNRLVFTDGYDKMSIDDKKYNSVIWLVYENKEFKPKHGQVVFIDENLKDNSNFINEGR